MGHGLTRRADGRWTMAYIGKMPWHGLGQELTEEQGKSIQLMREASGQNFEVEKIQLRPVDDENPVDSWCIRRRDTREVLSPHVGSLYTIVQPGHCLEWFQPFLDSGEASLHTAGVLYNGKKIWCLAKLNKDPMVIAKGDEVDKFIMLSNSYDGSSNLRVGFTPIRIVCNNTLAMAHRKDTSQLIRFKHTPSIHMNMENIREVMNLANQSFEATAEQYRLLARKDISQNDLQRYIKIVFKLNDNVETWAKQTKDLYEKINYLFEAGKGNAKSEVRGTYWSAYNSVTEFLNYNAGRNVDSRLNSLWFGRGSEQSHRALELALEMAA